MDAYPDILIGYQVRGRAVLKARGPVESGGTMPWLAVDIHVWAGGFEGYISDYLSMGHLSQSASELENLYRTFRGKAVLGSIDGNFTVELHGNGLGKVLASLDTMDDIGRLTFVVDLDQTFLPDIIEQIRRIDGVFSARYGPHGRETR
jgi:hypothetical protein